MAEKKLAAWLKDEYVINNDGTIKLKTESYKFYSQILKKDIVIPSKHITIIGFSSKNNKGFITRCCRKISHAYLLKLKDEHNVTLTEPEILQWPTEENDLWGVSKVKIVDTDIIEFGETHISNLKGTDDYPITMLIKRATDRAVSRAIGLYSENFLTESENIAAYDGEEISRINYDDLPPRKIDNSDKINDEEQDKENKSESIPEPETENDIPDDKFLINKIKILSNLCNDVEDDVLFNIELEVNKNLKSIEDLDQLNSSKLQAIVDYYEENKFENDDDLAESLFEVVKDYKSEKKLSIDKFKNEICGIIEKEPDVVDLRELTINEIYSLIDYWELWK